MAPLLVVLVLALLAPAEPQADVASLLETLLTEAVTSAYPCTLLLAMAPFPPRGCSSPARSGAAGTLVPIESAADLAALLAASMPPLPVAVVLPSDLFTGATLSALTALRGHLAGAIVLLSTPGLPFSDAVASQLNPSGRGLLGVRLAYPVFAVTDPAQIALIRARASSNAALSPAVAFPQFAARFSAYMGPPDTGLDSAGCLAAGSCLPLGGFSIWAALGGLDSAPPTANASSGSRIESSRVASASNIACGSRVQRPLVLATAPLDATAFFHGLATGSDAAASSLVALVAAAEALSHFKAAAAALPLQIMFAAFQGESFGRLGSRRFMSESFGGGFACAQNVTAVNSPTGRVACAFPLRYDATFACLAGADLAFVLAADQLGLTPAAGPLFAHPLGSGSNTTSGPNSLAAQRSAWAASVLGALGPMPLPVLPGVPSAAQSDPGALSQSFEADAAQPSTPLLSVGEFAPRAGGVVLAEYNTTLTSRVFRSEFDNASNASPSAIAAAATVMARALFALAANASTAAAAAAAVPPLLQANASFVSQMLECITVDAQCALFAQLLGLGSSAADMAPLAPAGERLSLYTSVYNQPAAPSGPGSFSLQPALLEAVVRAALASFTAPPPPLATTACASTADCAAAGQAPPFECLLGLCVAGQAFFHDAISLALDATTAAGVYVVDASRASAMGDPVFTEPFWSLNVGLALLQVDAPWLDATLFTAGLLVTAAAAAASVRFAQAMDAHYKVA